MSGEEDENISLDDAELKEMQAKGRAYATAPSTAVVVCAEDGTRGAWLLRLRPVAGAF